MYLLLVIICMGWLIYTVLCKTINWVLCGGQSKEVTVNISSVSDVEQSENKIFRPSTFDEYIGQEKAKNIIKTYIHATREREMVMPHVIISGIAGTGKTTLANIIANQLGVKFVETIASSIDCVEKLRELIVETDGGVLFIDEVHGADRDLVETIYMAMEDFKIDGEPIKQFTLIGSTTEIGEIIKDRKPFYERFKVRIKLESYTDGDLSIIAQQWKNKSYPLDILKDELFKEIGLNSKGSPRTSIRLTEATVLFNGDLKSVLKNFDIINGGYTNEDLKTLDYIAENDKGVGLNGLVSFLNTSKANYNYEIEPYLVQQRLIQRTPRGRKITEKKFKLSKKRKNDSVSFLKKLLKSKTISDEEKKEITRLIIIKQRRNRILSKKIIKSEVAQLSYTLLKNLGAGETVTMCNSELINYDARDVLQIMGCIVRRANDKKVNLQ